MSAQTARGRTGSGWAAWLRFAGIMIATLGLFQGLQGLVALFDDSFSVLVGDELLVFDLTAWGWTHVGLGTLMFAAGVGVLTGALWGRVLGVVVAVLSILAQLMIMPVYPIWASVVIALDTMVVYALVVHGAEVEVD